MTYLWSQVKLELGRLLDDSGVNPTWTDALRMDAYNRALEALAYHTACATATGWTADGGNTISRPPNAVDGVEYVYIWDETNEVWWKPIRFRPGQVAPDPTPSSDGVDRTYYEWPRETITLSSIPAVDTEFIINYFSYYPEVLVDSSEVIVPRWSREAVLCYAAAYCMNPSATSASKIRQYNQKVDSGNPEQNPFERRIKAYLDRWYSILQSHPPQDKAPPFFDLRS